MTDWLAGMDDEQLAELSAYIVQRANEARRMGETTHPEAREAYRAKARAWRKLHDWLRARARTSVSTLE